MPKLTADEIITQGHLRYFYQPGGAAPGNEVLYAGFDGQYMWVEDATNPKSGGISPINMHDPRQPKKYRRVSKTVDAPDFPTATVQFAEKHGAIPQQLIGFDCPMNFYQVAGACNDLSDIVNGWRDYVKIYSNGEETSASEMGGSQDSDDAILDGLDYTFANIYPVGKLQFGEELETGVTKEVIDIAFGPNVSCGNCGGREDDGTQALYALVKENSGVAAGFVAYRVGNTAGTSAITGAANTDVMVALDVIGRYIVVVYSAAAAAVSGYYVAEINQLTGVPGTWSKVQTGFVAGFNPTDLYAANPREIYFSAEAGYVYKSTNILQGVSVINAADTTGDDLNRVHGTGETVYASGENGTTIYSLNRGDTWAACTVAPFAAETAGLWVVSDNKVWAVSAGGVVKYSKDRGESWTTVTMPAGATIATGQDIVFATDEVGYILAATAGPAGLIYGTFDGGETWFGSTPLSGRFTNYPVIDRANRAATPLVDNFGIAANHVAVGGLAGDGADGVVLTGEATVI